MTKTNIALGFLSLCLLISCGMPTKIKDGGRQFSTSNPIFADQIEEFETEGKKRSQNPNFTIGDVPVNFGDTENPDFEGVCFTYSNGESEVIIRKSWWDKASRPSKDSLLFHELGHCVLKRPHTEETIEVGGTHHKKSMMNATIVSGYQFLSHREGYLDELFTYDEKKLVNSFQKN